MKNFTLASIFAILLFCGFTVNTAQAQGEKWENETLMIEFKTTAGKVLGGGYVATLDPVLKNNIKKVVIVSTSGVEEMTEGNLTISGLLKTYQDEGWEPYSEQLFMPAEFPRIVLAYSFRRKIQ
ncbi:MAG: hypothetical protein ACOCZ8_06115 [Bacteroidota bacterium]